MSGYETAHDYNEELIPQERFLECLEEFEKDYEDRWTWAYELSRYCDEVMEWIEEDLLERKSTTYPNLCDSSRWITTEESQEDYATRVVLGLKLKRKHLARIDSEWKIRRELLDEEIEKTLQEIKDEREHQEHVRSHRYWGI